MSEMSLTVAKGRQVYEFCEVESTEAIKEVKDKLASDPENIELLMEKAKAEVANWDYQSAIDTYSKAIALDPTKAILYRWRGHRLINVRMVPEGVADLTLSAQLDPGNWETWYHLGLGHYLLRNHEKAVQVYANCMDCAPTLGDRVAVADWSWRNLMRLGKKDQAAKTIEFITEDMDYGENFAYHRCLMMYKGIVAPEKALDREKETDINKVTIGYGLGNYYFVQGQPERAREIWKRVMTESYWPAFGYIAAEFEAL